MALLCPNKTQSDILKTLFVVKYSYFYELISVPADSIDRPKPSTNRAGEKLP